MSVLWCGGEDTSFPNGASIISSTSFCRTMARCAIQNNSNGSSFLSKSTTYTSSTSLWLTFRVYIPNFNATAIPFAAGFGNSGGEHGLGIGWTVNSGLLQVVQLASGVVTPLVTSSVGLTSGTVFRVDIQLINYGANGTINVYINNAFITSYTGNLSIAGVTGFDSVFFAGSNNSGVTSWYSEFIVASDSTLGRQGLVTCAPNGNGTTQTWTNPAYTNFNPITIDDANSTYVNVVGEDEQATLIQIPAGNFLIDTVKVEARALATSGAATTNLKLGLSNSGTVGTGPAHALSSGFTTVEDYFATDPTNGGAAWPATLANYQLDMRSA